MGKIRVTTELIQKAQANFVNQKMVKSEEITNVSRSELRVLVRKGILKKIQTFKERKYREVAPTTFYVYEWIGVKREF